MLMSNKQRNIGSHSSPRLEKGQAQAEFALIIVFLMLLIAGFIELVMMVYAYNVLADSAKEGVRYAVVHGSLNANPSGPTCPCSDIDGRPAPSGSAPGNGSGYGVVRTFAQLSGHYVSGTAMTRFCNWGLDASAVTGNTV